MMLALLLLRLSSLLAISAHSAARPAVMEGLATTNTTIYISTGNSRVGIGTNSPAQTLDVRGNIVGTSSVTANAFFGNGSALTGITSSGVTATSSPTWSGNHTFLHTVTVSSNIVASSSITGTAFFGDGSALTNLPSSPVAQSSFTYGLNGATTETTNFTTCYASGTLTTGGTAPIAVFYSGDITSSGAAGTYCVINFLQDGAYISPASKTIGMGKAASASAGGAGNGTTVRIFPAPSAGSHSWCVSLISPFGATCTFTNTSVLGNQFGVVELR